jgi:hypothetical protein
MEREVGANVMFWHGELDVWQWRIWFFFQNIQAKIGNNSEMNCVTTDSLISVTTRITVLSRHM